MSLHGYLRELTAQLRHTLPRHELRAYALELERPILIRFSGAGDEAALSRLAALDSRRLPEGSFLLVEIDGEVVAAAPLDVEAALLKDPFRRTANLRELLRLQADYVRRHPDALARSVEAAAPAHREAA